MSLVGIHCKEEGLTFARIKWKTLLLIPALQSKQSSLCGLHGSTNRKREGPSCQIVSTKRAADGRKQKSTEIIDEQREKYRTKNVSLRILDGLGRNGFCDFDKPQKRACQKGKIESNEQSKEGGQPK